MNLQYLHNDDKFLNYLNNFSKDLSLIQTLPNNFDYFPLYTNVNSVKSSLSYIIDDSLPIYNTTFSDLSDAYMYLYTSYFQAHQNWSVGIKFYPTENMFFTYSWSINSWNHYWRTVGNQVLLTLKLWNTTDILRENLTDLNHYFNFSQGINLDQPNYTSLSKNGNTINAYLNGQKCLNPLIIPTGSIINDFNHQARDFLGHYANRHCVVSNYIRLPFSLNDTLSSQLSHSELNNLPIF